MEKSVFVLANDVFTIINEKKPSRFVPFKGNFPLLSPALEEEYSKEITSGKTIDDVAPWVRDIIYKALKIKRIDEGFVEYLKYNGIWKQFPKLSNADKATELIRFLNANSMTLEYLEIN